MTRRPETPKLLLDPQTWNTLHDAHLGYKAETSPTYDEVLSEVTSRIQVSGSIGKTAIGALVFWKRLQANTPWVPELMSMREKDVRAVTEKAVTAVNDKTVPVPQAASDGRRALLTLPGCKTRDALASALLLAAAPQRMAVYDRRAQKSLKALGLSLTAKPGRYRRYMELVEALCMTASHHNRSWIARDVDVALYGLGGPQPDSSSGSTAAPSNTAIPELQARAI
jgi:hypothetical protein